LVVLAAAAGLWQTVVLVARQLRLMVVVPVVRELRVLAEQSTRVVAVERDSTVEAQEVPALSS
jgi:hypothetical protein